ncbi:MAG: DUF819 family protein [Candidatus Dadabacteria bacterium]|nr:MAG: DUF819 family protein [Candidatus Dadabacteria bacterium]
MQDALLLLLLFGLPALFVWAEPRFKWVRTISPVVLCYGSGILIGNLAGPWNTELTQIVTEAVVVLALPMLLFPSDLKAFTRLAPVTALSFALAVVAIIVTSVVGTLLFGGGFSESWMVSALLVGVYTGGTPNMAAIAQSLQVPDELYLLVNAADLVLGSFYLLVLMTVAKPILGRWFPPFPETVEDAEDAIVEETRRITPAGIAFSVLLSAFVVGASAGLVQLVTGTLHPAGVILTLTTLAILLSFSPAVRRLPGAYEGGQYLLLVFCIAIGSMANVNDLIASLSDVFGYCAFVLFGAIFLHIVLARLFRVDVDTLIITSTAAVFGPPFIGPIAEVIGNRKVVVSGITAGVVGLAIGNYLGYALGRFLMP